MPIRYESISIDEGFRLDLLIEGKRLVELKPVERTALGHKRQVLTYLRLLNLPLGLLIDFGAEAFMEGIQRVANGHRDILSSGLRIHS